MDNGERIAIPRHPRERRRTGPGHESHVQGSNPERTYYIVPPGMTVIFRDEYGNELERVFGGDEPDGYDEAPVELTDEYGRIVYKTGENYTDDGSDISEATFRPKVVHLGQYISNGSVIPRSSSPLAISLDRRGRHQHIQLEHSEDGSFGGSQGSERSFSPHLSHTRSEGNLASHLQPQVSFGSGSHGPHIRLRRIYP
ncbi:hypothetical protein BJV74DRAFT_562564 [Russula compacta]|nr:hypothetical protein BJV74DRAFT_562564 [Russula compacta]